MNIKKISAIAVFLEKRKSRIYVGKLYRKNNDFIFQYSDQYLHTEHIIPVGPDLPLTKKIHHAGKLFESLQDRLPSKENPAYGEYCQTMGISIDENDPLVLLATIGRRGPSSLIFEPIFSKEFTSKDVLRYRKWLGLTQREFASCFEFSKSTLIRIEHEKEFKNEVLKRLELYMKFPETACYQIIQNSGWLNDDKTKEILKKIKQEIFI
ncbi:MAG: HipA N-terminal domain-containing protein [Parachlamydiales bacterium]|nr:HipA N-terminal domain-containing protein [Parachlamydiales bacterium]